MLMPDSVTVGPMTYKILECEQIPDSVGSDGRHYLIWGMKQSYEGLISILENATEQRKAFVLMHEIVHAMMDDANATVPEEIEETVVDILAREIVDLIRQNPALITYYQGVFGHALERDRTEGQGGDAGILPADPLPTSDCELCS